MRPLLASLFICLLTSAAGAETRTWTGATNGQWSEASNWDSAPVEGDDLIFPSGAANPSTENDFPPDTSFQSITISGSGYTLAGNPIVLGSGGLSCSGTATVAISVTLAAAQRFAVTRFAASLEVSGNVDLNGTALTLDAINESNGTLSGSVSGSGHLIKSGPAAWDLSGDNSFSGDVVVERGYLYLLHPNALGVADNTEANGTTVNAGGSLVFANLVFPSERVTLNGRGQTLPSSAPTGVLQVLGSAILNGSVVLGADVGMNMPSGYSVTFNGPVIGGGRFGMGGPGVYVLSHPGNSFTGGVAWGVIGSNDSVLRCGANNVLPVDSSGPKVNLDAPSRGLLDIHGTTQTIGVLAGGGDIDLGSGGDLTIVGGNVLQFNGVIRGAGTVNLVHLVILAANNVYTGTFNVLKGAVLAITGGLAASIQSEGTLTLTRATIGPVTIMSPNIIDISRGTTRTGNLLLAPGSRFSAQIDGADPTRFGNLRVTGTVNLGAALELYGDSDTAPGDALIVIENDGNDSVVGTFAGVPEGSSIALRNHYYRVSYVGGDGNDVVFTAIAATSATDVVIDYSPKVPLFEGDEILFSASVQNVAAGPPPPTGTIRFFDGDALLGTFALTTGPNGSSAAFTTTSLTAGSHSVIASYSGDATHAPSSSRTALLSILTRDNYPPSFNFTASPSKIRAGESAVLTWSVTSATSVSIDNGIGIQPSSGSVIVAPLVTTKYMLIATGAAAGPVVLSVTVTVASEPLVTFTATPDSINPGQSSTLSWSTTDATSVTIDNGIGAQPLSGSIVVSPLTTTVFTLTATGPGGTTKREVTVGVSSGPAITFTATPDSITLGQLSTLAWSAPGAISVTLDHGIGPKPTSGSTTVSPSSTTIYTLRAAGPGGESAATVRITVIASPDVTFNATPRSISPGRSSTLTWTTDNATGVSIDNGIGPVAASGSRTVTPATTTTYVLTATGPGGTKNVTVTVTVIGTRGRAVLH